MITGIQGTAYIEGTLDQDQSASKLGRDDFLQIFLAQLRHQDPINPMEGTEFTAQLAQFTSLEQLFNVNENLEAIKTVQDDASRFEALSLMGKEIQAEGSTLSLTAGSEAKGKFQIGGNASCTVIIVDGVGNPIRQIPLGRLGAGQHDFSWDGRDDSGFLQSSGVYRFEVASASETGSAMRADTLISGRVTRVSLEGSEPKIYVGEIPVGLSQVRDVRVSAEDQQDVGLDSIGALEDLLTV